MFASSMIFCYDSSVAKMQWTTDVMTLYIMDDIVTIIDGCVH